MKFESYIRLPGKLKVERAVDQPMRGERRTTNSRHQSVYSQFSQPTNGSP